MIPRDEPQKDSQLVQTMAQNELTKPLVMKKKKGNLHVKDFLGGQRMR